MDKTYYNLTINSRAFHSYLSGFRSNKEQVLTILSPKQKVKTPELKMILNSNVPKGL